MNPANSAIKYRIARMMAPTVATRCRRKRRQKSCEGDRCSTLTGFTASGFWAAGSMSTQADARVAPGKEKVRNEIADHKERSGHDDAGDHKVRILREERFHSQTAEAGPSHNVLDDKCTTEKASERITEN